MWYIIALLAVAAINIWKFSDTKTPPREARLALYAGVNLTALAIHARGL
ncbi:hypothetical protein [Sulfitobacter sp. SK011]|nr:hypothetical protein [Sulfitobacter sp. SK011]